MIDINTACHICGAQQLKLHPNYTCLPRVASDCVPWRSGGQLATCQSCHCVQNPIDDNWRTQTSEIYSQYKIYKQSAGSEQGVFSGGTHLTPRSAKIFQHATPYLNLQQSGRLLDIGCANGELLRYFSTLAPQWGLAGFEIDDKRRQEVESIPQVVQFASGSLDKLKGQFDLITLIHVLEHLPNPCQWLKALDRLLTPNGMILIQVPDPKKNPFNLLVADHCSHFLLPELIAIAQAAGYEVITATDQWVAREFSLLIRRKKHTENTTQPENRQGSTLADIATYPSKSISWLEQIITSLKAIPEGTPRGIWGTAIAATWLYAIMNENVDFFVDEDPNRIGQMHLGKPVYHPSAAPAGSHIYIALTPEIASHITERWSHLDVTLHAPPKLDY